MKTANLSFKWFFGLIILALLLPVVAHFVLGSYNRALADDFCFAAMYWEKGIIGSLDWYYQNWTGVYASLVSLSLLAMTHGWRYVPLLLVGGLALSSMWFSYQLATTLRLRYRGYAAVTLALALCFGILSGTANVFQSFYWASGSITYTGPLVIFLVYLGLLLALTRQEAPVRWWQFALAAGLPLLSGGFTQMYAVLQILVYGLLIGVALWRAQPGKKRRYLRFLGVSLLFALLALLISYVAPGNAVRQSAFDDLLTLPQAMLQTITGALSFIPTALVYISPLAVLMPLFLAGVVAFYCHPLSAAERHRANRSSLKWLGLAGLVGYGLIAAAFFTTLYSIGQLPAARAYVIPQMILVMMGMAWGYIMGLGLQKKHATTPPRLAPAVMVGILALVIVSVAQAARETLALLPDFQVYAREWDARDAFLTTTDAQGDVLTVQPFTQDMATYAWLDNPHLACIRDYYHQPTLVIPEANKES